MKLSKSKFSTIVYSLFLVSGMLKSVMIYFDISFYLDITLVFSIYITLDIVLICFQKGISLSKNYRLFLILLLLFTGLAFTTLLYTPSPYFGYYKSGLLILNILSFLYPAIVHKLDVALLFKTLWRITVPFSVFIIFINFVRWSPYKTFIDIDKADLIRGNYLGAGLFLGLIALFYLNQKIKSIHQIFLKIVLPTFLLLVSSARGPLVFFVAVLGIKFIFFSNPKINLKVVLMISLSFLVLAFTSVREIVLTVLERTITRFSHIFLQDGGGSSLQGRYDYYSFSINKIMDNPEKIISGFGIGSFNLLYTGVDGRGYPHNILLESLFEFGFLNFSILAFLLFSIFLFRKKNKAVLLPLFVLLCFSKSGGLEDTRILFASYALFFIKSY